MFIGLKNIQFLFSSCPNRLRDFDDTHCLTGWNKLINAPTPYTNHVLYVCTEDISLETISFSKGMHLLCIAKASADLNEIAKQYPDCVNLLIVQDANPSQVYAKLRDYYDVQCGISMYGHTLLEFLDLENGLESAIEYSYQVFRNPIFVFDINFNLIAASWTAIKELGIHDDVVINRCLSDDDYRMVSRRNNLHKRVEHSDIPIQAYNEQLGYDQMYCAITTGKKQGHICISAVNKPFEPIDRELLLILKKYVDQQMEKDAFIRTSRGFNYEYLLRDLLDNKFMASQTNSAQMNYVKEEFIGHMCCMLIETARTSVTVNVKHLRNVMETRFPRSKVIIYNGQIVAILPIIKEQLIPKEYLEEAEKICVENGLFAGLSNCFSNIFNLIEYYNQALHAIELGTSRLNEPGLFLYQSYSLDHVKNTFMQKESAEIFCHPKMRFLLDYDKKHHSELAFTLYMYLTHERNLAATAEVMQMHRTSLVYRFKKINALLNDDFNDYRERMYLILSYEMNQK